MAVIGITTVIQSYVIIAEANGYVMGKSPTAPSPYAVWQVDDDGEGVCCGHYFNDREEAEWDFCAKAFDWFEDNVNIHMIEDDGNEQIEDKLLKGLRRIRAEIAAISELADEMSAEVDRLRKERHNDNNNSN